MEAHVKYKNAHMGLFVGNIFRGMYASVFWPSRLVSVPDRQTSQGLLQSVRQGQKLLFIYLVNLALYAGPLTLAGIGIGSGSGVPDWFVGFAGEDPSLLMIYMAGFIQNSAYLFGVTLATLLGIHLALLITFQSKGFLRTAYSIVYSTSIYLAGMFTVVWYLTTAEGVANARELVINLQIEFIYRVIELIGSDMAFEIPRPDQIAPGEFSLAGEIALVGLVILFLYYLYSLYLGTRLNHEAGRFEGVIAVLVVISLPILYVVGSILAVTLQLSPV